MQMEVRGSANQYSNRGMLYYGVVNKLANAEAKFGTRLHHAQLTFFKAIVSGYSLCCVEVVNEFLYGIASKSAPIHFVSVDGFSFA